MKKCAMRKPGIEKPAMKPLNYSFALLAFCLVLPRSVAAQETRYDMLTQGMGTLSRLSNAKTRSISPENFAGEKGKGGMATEGTGAMPPFSARSRYSRSASKAITATGKANSQPCA